METAVMSRLSRLRSIISTSFPTKCSLYNFLIVSIILYARYSPLKTRFSEDCSASPSLNTRPTSTAGT
ncbi:hypothetical protein DPMN_092216 [Dreissena polymorpha]|uniref:Uncharacterized protein n=1 Tax=Dreissena polymorpha TaxID=45954 RepID=A0A9D4R0S0_DREPO|nr:hypothetical protein DPMN_092216 [Dreissena polymorpha]